MEIFSKQQMVLRLGLPLPRERGGVRQLAKLILLGCCVLPISNSFAQPNAQNDLFTVLQNACNNYLDVTANDQLDSLAFVQLQTVSQPANGTVGVNGNYLFYCPQQGFTGGDQFSYAVSDSFRSDTATVYINVLPPNSQINPGDADENGKVEHFDVLAIGLSYDFSGPSRDTVTNNSLAWSPLSFINSDPGAADCNGDGIVDSMDVVVIENDFGNTFPILKPYTVDTSDCTLSGIPLTVESLFGDTINDGDTLFISVKLGTNLIPAEAYGIAFTLELDTGFIGTSIVQFSTNNSWLLQNDPGIFFKKDSPSGRIDVALTKTNHSPAAGDGEVLLVIMPIDDNIDGIVVGPGWHDLYFNISEIRLVSEYNIVRDVCVQQKSLHIYKSATSSRQPDLNDISVYPNPNSGKLFVEGKDIRGIEITDLAGKKVLSEKYYQADKVTLAVSDISSGIYLVTVRTGNSVFVNKIFIQP